MVISLNKGYISMYWNGQYNFNCKFQVISEWKTHLDSFIAKFKGFLISGLDANLELYSHDGKAWRHTCPAWTCTRTNTTSLALKPPRIEGMYIFQQFWKFRF